MRRRPRGELAVRCTIHTETALKGPTPASRGIHLFGRSFAARQVGLWSTILRPIDRAFAPKHYIASPVLGLTTPSSIPSIAQRAAVQVPRHGCDYPHFVVP